MKNGTSGAICSDFLAEIDDEERIEEEYDYEPFGVYREETEVD